MFILILIRTVEQDVIAPFVLCFVVISDTVQDF